MLFRKLALVSMAGALAAAAGAAQAGQIFSETFAAGVGGNYGGGTITGTQFAVTSGNIDLIGLPSGSPFACVDNPGGNCLDLVGASAQGGIASVPTFTLHAGATYTVDFGANLQGYGPADIASTLFDVSLGGVTLAQTLSAADANHHFSLVFSPGADLAGAVLNFQSVTSPDSVHGAVIDNITINEQLAAPPPTGGVPEPASWALLILGFGGVGAVLRHRRLAVA